MKTPSLPTTPGIRAFTAAFAAACLLWAGPARAAHITTPAQLRQAVESSPGNVVIIDHPTKITGLGFVEVATGATLVLRPGASLELDRTWMHFNGPLVVQGDSAEKTEIKLLSTTLSAHSVRFDLPGAGTSMTSDQTSLQATVGDCVIAFGQECKIEIKARGLSAAGAVEVSGGRKFSGVFDAARIATGTGVLILIDGDEGGLKLDEVTATATHGSCTITTTGLKAGVEVLKCNFEFRDYARLRLLGESSGMTVKETRFDTVFWREGPTAPPALGVVIESGAGSASFGKLEMSKVTIDRLGTATMGASLGGEKGSLLLDDSFVRVSGDVRIETGAQGETTAKNDRLISATRVRIASGPGGTTSHSNNTIVAPIQEIVP